MPKKYPYPSTLIRKLCRENTCTLPHSPKSYAGKIPVPFHTHSRVMPTKPVHSHNNSTGKSYWKIPVRFHILLFESYANKSVRSRPNSFRKLCQIIPVHFHTHLKVTPGNPCRL